MTNEDGSVDVDPKYQILMHRAVDIERRVNMILQAAISSCMVEGAKGSELAQQFWKEATVTYKLDWANYNYSFNPMLGRIERVPKESGFLHGFGGLPNPDNFKQ